MIEILLKFQCEASILDTSQNGKGVRKYDPESYPPRNGEQPIPRHAQSGVKNRHFPGSAT